MVIKSNEVLGPPAATYNRTQPNGRLLRAGRAASASRFGLDSLRTAKRRFFCSLDTKAGDGKEEEEDAEGAAAL